MPAKKVKASSRDLYLSQLKPVQLYTSAFLSVYGSRNLIVGNVSNFSIKAASSFTLLTNFTILIYDRTGLKVATCVITPETREVDFAYKAVKSGDFGFVFRDRLGNLLLDFTFAAGTLDSPSGRPPEYVLEKVKTSGFYKNILTPFTVLSLSPDYILPGDVISVTGTGFTPSTKLSLDGFSIPVTYIDSEHVSFIAPGVGPHTVNRLGFVVRSAASYNFIKPDFISEGDVVTIHGQGIRSSNQVILDGQSVSKVFIDSSKVTFIAPAPGPHIVNDLPFQVTVPFFTSLSPSIIYPGTPVTITGGNFNSDTPVILDTVKIGSQFVDQNRLVFTAPAADNIVHYANGLSFRVRQAPVYQSLSSVNVAQGSLVRVYGLNFTPDIVLYLDGAPTQTQYISGTEITFIAPDVLGTHTVATLSFEVVESTDVLFNSLSPTDKYVGDTLTLEGRNFSAGMEILLDGAPLTYTFIDNRKITFIAPALGSHTVGSITFSVSARPVFLSLTPAITSPGQTITITGANFTPSTTLGSGLLPVVVTFIDSQHLSFSYPAVGTFSVQNLPFTITPSPNLISADTPAFVDSTSIIRGTGFYPEMNLTLTSSTGQTSNAFTYISPTQISVINPAVTGVTTITVYNDSITYNVNLAPTFISLSTTQAYPNSVISVIGTNFTPEIILVLDGVPVTTTYVSNTVLRFQAPNYNLSFSNNHIVNGLSFSVILAPIINNLSPAYIFPGTVVTVTGVNFTPDMPMTIDGVPITFTYVNSTVFTFVAPGLGLHSLTTILFLVRALPIYDSLSNVLPYEGEIVTVSGSNFFLGLSLTVDGSNVNTTYINANSLSFTAIGPGQHVVSGLSYEVLAVGVSITSQSAVTGSAGDIITLTGTSLGTASAIKFCPIN